MTGAARLLLAGALGGLLAGCSEARARPPPATTYERAPRAWESTCIITCSDGTARSITSRIAREREPAGPPCDYALDAVRADACEADGVFVRDCGGCTPWVESR